MDVKGANPFLFNDDDYTSPNNVQSNPFLMDDQDDFMGGNDNPFLSQTAAAPATGGTNPFAFDPMDYGPTEAQPVDISASFQPQTTNAFNPMDQNVFIDTQDMMTQNEPITDFFIDTTNTIVPNIIPQKPTELDLKYTNTVADFDDVNNDTKKKLPPPRPPPSKETQDLFMSAIGEMDATSSHLLDRIPPTRTPSPVSMRDLHSPSPTPEPQFGDLLDVSDNSKIDDLMSMSQEEVCDINQNQNLPVVEQSAMIHQTEVMQPIHPITPVAEQPMMQPQRTHCPIVPPLNEQPTMIQPNRPVPPALEQTEMIQPSSVPAQPPRPLPIIPQQPVMMQSSPPVVAPVTEQPVVVQPTRPTPPVRPPRPQPPQKPPPPTFAQPQTIKTEIPPQPVAPAKPPPPIPPSPVRLPPQRDEFMDMFDAPPTAPKTTADIMNLYNKKQETQVDLLSDNYDTAIASTEVTEQSMSESDSRKNSMPSSENTIIQSNVEKPNLDSVMSSPQIQDNFLSPQADTQMDTSDSLSKESVSSATFNPFATIEETSPTNPSLIPSQEFALDNQPFQDNTAPFIINDACVDENIIGTGAFDTNGSSSTTNIFGTETTNVPSNAYSIDTFIGNTNQNNLDLESTNSGFHSFNEPDAFDAFAAKFESATKDENKNGTLDAFGSSGDAWGSDSGFNENSSGFNDNAFGAEDKFDSFLAMKEPPRIPQSTPNRMNRVGSLDSDEEKDFSVVIKPKGDNEGFHGALPVLAPPPIPTMTAFSDASRINPFDQSDYDVSAPVAQDFTLPLGGEVKRSESQETPPTPLYDEDVSQPLEPFPRIDFKGEGWEMQLRQPNKKKITGQRFWKKIFVRLVYQPDCILLQLYNQQSDKDPFQELPLQPCYSVSDIGAQQYDNFGKIFTVKLQYIFYKERPGVRPGQVKKAERITNKLSQFAAYAIQGDYQHCKEFGSDLKKLGLPVEHAPQVSQLMKIGSLNFEDLKQFSVSIEEALFKLQAHRDRALHYKMEEVQVTAVDELYVEQDSEGHIEKQIARVRLFFLGFLTGMPDIELGINDMRRQGKEVVGRHDIIPVVTEEWIRLEAVEFHNSVQQVEYNDTHIIKFKPPDACYIELLRFRVRPPKNRELPLQLKAQICVTGTKVELRADVLVPGFASRKLGQVPCEDVMIRFPIPECWIYMFRVEKHFRYGSVKSAHRRTGKIKGIERILGTVDTLQESLIEVTSGQAKYEHQHRAIVWRCPRLPKEGQGAYTTHNMVCRLSLTSFDQIPDQLAEYCYVEFTMPATQVSHTTVRSVSLQNSDSDEPPEKYVRYLARHEYRVGIEHTAGEGPAAYLAATHVSKPPPAQEEKPKPIPEAESSSDSD